MVCFLKLLHFISTKQVIRWASQDEQENIYVPVLHRLPGISWFRKNFDKLCLKFVDVSLCNNVSQGLIRNKHINHFG